MTAVTKLASDPFYTGTSETVPCLIWMDEVILAAIRIGADPNHLRDREIREKLRKAYSNREPMWMGADLALQLSKAHSGSICGHCGGDRERCVKGGF